MNRILALSISLCVISIITQRLFGMESMLYQLAYLILGLVAYIVVIHIDKTTIFRLAKPLGYGGIVLLLILLIIGEATRGSRRWFFIGGFGIQPSVLFLPPFALHLALTFTTQAPRRIGQYIKYICLIAIPVLLVFKQPDLGTSIVISSTLFALFIASGVRLKHILVSVLLLIPLLFVTPHVLKPYQRDRLISFMDPLHDPSGINYNSLQAVIAIGSGGLFGKGLLSATQSKLYFLPEAHTDFVFGAFSETFGFVGALFLISLYFLLFAQLLRENQRRNHVLFKLFSLSFFMYVFIQFVFNIGMNLRLLPVVGIPLPFLSYGGSSLLTLFLFLAIREKLKEVEI